eukprot:TRINITY_DN15066_c0_g1_i1.p1 TRINITY_DN15066_c0_g1~~TRINITY_DN15066_c0_g1_i1.p1  ORF type:complete len:141 (+),score=37.72 TRINITY_DN15066_c0_g1_i1:135-557(+)
MALIGLAILANRKSSTRESRKLLDRTANVESGEARDDTEDVPEQQPQGGGGLEEYTEAAAGAACVSNGSMGEMQQIQYSPAIGPIEVFSSPSGTNDGSDKELSPDEHHRPPRRLVVSVDEIELNEKTLLESPEGSESEKV